MYEASRRQVQKSNTSLAVKSFASVLLGVMVIALASVLADADSTNAGTGQDEKPKLTEEYFAKFKRPEAPPLPAAEVRLTMGAEMRGTIDNPD